ncbi:DUF1800 domain-containing protein [Herminiimonas arsenitoxidans]|uniref:DUF1800 domain-containing protein n=1 Tax=Herminiimonas arsenitoxidans TaxID=1809410 RepID=UPI00097085DC|nr:DUF1800 domain-containing protein [Herminiimonas arsenitoxidans]
MQFHTRLAALFIVALCAFNAHAANVSQDQQVLLVLNRLGYGPKPGDIERVKQIGITRYIDQQLHPENIPLPATLVARLDALDTVNQADGILLGNFLSLRKAATAQKDEEAKQQQRAFVTRLTDQTAEARLAQAIDSPRQLQEVMVDFWFNHFNVFSGKGLDRALVGSYERDAIRPYALGSFRDLLGATAKHPAMLFYLDNWLSTSAEYQARRKNAQNSGLNENYARELMELHTLGVDGGYSQNDVTELARIFTGWTFDQRDMVMNNRTFRFDPQRHDYGDKQWLGQTIRAEGQLEGERALDILAMHPATARHLSYQLAQYFVQDQPPPALVERLSRRYLETGGNIREVLLTLFNSREFMAQAGTGSKFKTPYQFVVSAARAGQVQFTNVRPFLNALNQLGMPLYGCQTPDGYKNTESAWLNPDALTRRIAFANALASGRLPLNKINDEAQAMNPPAIQNPPPLNTDALLDTLGPGISAQTRTTIENNPANLRSAMVLGSPDFMQQ